MANTLNKTRDKFVTCMGCRRRHTINYLTGDTQKTVKCTNCGKYSTHLLNLKNEKRSN